VSCNAGGGGGVCVCVWNILDTRPRHVVLRDNVSSVTWHIHVVLWPHTKAKIEPLKSAAFKWFKPSMWQWNYLQNPSSVTLWPVALFSYNSVALHHFATRNHHDDVRFISNLAGCCSCNVLGLNSGGTRFESRQSYGSFWLRLFVVSSFFRGDAVLVHWNTSRLISSKSFTTHKSFICLHHSTTSTFNFSSWKS
jgi:hypothetical protein